MMQKHDYLQLAEQHSNIDDALTPTVNALLDIWSNRTSSNLSERDVLEARSRLALANDASKNAGNLREPFNQGHHVLTVAAYAREIADGISRTSPYSFLKLEPNDVEYMALVHDLGRIVTKADRQGIHSIVGYLHCTLCPDLS